MLQTVELCQLEMLRQTEKTSCIFLRLNTLVVTKTNNVILKVTVLMLYFLFCFLACLIYNIKKTFFTENLRS